MSDPSANHGLDVGVWTLDPAATSIGFSAKLVLGLKAKGHFTRYDSTVTVADAVDRSSIEVAVWTESIDTGIGLRDKHLRADNVFASQRFPTMEFRSTAIAESAGGLDVTGDLRVRDVTRPVTFHAARSRESGPPRYTASMPLSPKDFGVTRPGTTKPLEVVLDVTLKRR